MITSKKMSNNYRDSVGVLINQDYDYEWKYPEVDGYPDHSEEFLVAFWWRKDVNTIRYMVTSYINWKNRFNSYWAVEPDVLAWKRIEEVNMKKI